MTGQEIGSEGGATVSREVCDVEREKGGICRPRSKWRMWKREDMGDIDNKGSTLLVFCSSRSGHADVNIVRTLHRVPNNHSILILMSEPTEYLRFCVRGVEEN